MRGWGIPRRECQGSFARRWGEVQPEANCYRDRLLIRKGEGWSLLVGRRRFFQGNLFSIHWMTRGAGGYLRIKVPYRMMEEISKDVHQGDMTAGSPEKEGQRNRSSAAHSLHTRALSIFFPHLQLHTWGAPALHLYTWFVYSVSGLGNWGKAAVLNAYLLLAHSTDMLNPSFRHQRWH